jgi:hypothetical protein
MPSPARQHSRKQQLHHQDAAGAMPAADSPSSRRGSGDDLERATLMAPSSSSGAEHHHHHLRRSSKSSASGMPGGITFSQLVHSWFSRKFATGCAILLPIVVTGYVTYSFLALFDGLFSVRGF